MRARERRLLSSLALLSALWFAPCPAGAQDALGPGADFSDGDWEAILNLAPPPSMAATQPRRRSRGQLEQRDGERSSERPSLTQRERENSSEREGTRERRARSSSEADSSAGPSRRERKAGEERTARSEANERALSDERPERRDVRSDKRDERAGKSQDTRSAKNSARELPGSAASKYDELKRSWHQPWPKPAEELAARSGAAPALSLHLVGKTETPFVLKPRGPDGGFDDDQIAIATEAFGSWAGGPKVSARLLDLIYHAARHFGVFHVHLISGVRRDRSGSRHSHGLAADIVLPGVSDDELAAYFRPQGFLGVGIYTRAGFVHVDVRERSFFWLDKSPPGRRMRIIPVRGDEAKAADDAALARGQSGYINPPRLQKALHARYKRRLAQAKITQ